MPRSSFGIEGDDSEVGWVEELTDGSEILVVSLSGVKDEVWERNREVGGVVESFVVGIAREVRVVRNDEGLEFVGRRNEKGEGSEVVGVGRRSNRQGRSSGVPGTNPFDPAIPLVLLVEDELVQVRKVVFVRSWTSDGDVGEGREERDVLRLIKRLRR